MRIYLSSGHKYPGHVHGVASNAVHDDLAKGLSELGHEVRYQIKLTEDVSLPDGILPVSTFRGDEDILHHLGIAGLPETPLPWVRTSHSHVSHQGLSLDVLTPNDIAVSRTLAMMHGSERFVYNGIDPANFIFSETKDDFFLFLVSGVRRAQEKGLEIAFRISELTGIELRVAATSNNKEETEAFGRLCRDRGAVYLGAIHDTQKAETLSAAKALLFPSQLNEAFGLVIVEALMSGTPVIASNMGAIPEILDPVAGFVCEVESDYIEAVANIGKIASSDCRLLAFDRFHYMKMAQCYVNEYQREIERM